MYSRGLSGGNADYIIPEKYDGTALLDLPTEEDVTCGTAPKFIDTPKKEIKFSPPEITPERQKDTDDVEKDAEPTGAFSSGPMKWIRGILPTGFKLDGLLPKIELEELIIIGLAAFLFFSKSGDKECALILLALIFIN